MCWIKLGGFMYWGRNGCPRFTSAREANHIHPSYKYSNIRETASFNSNNGDKRERLKQVSLASSPVEMGTSRKVQVWHQPSSQPSGLLHLSGPDMGFCSLVHSGGRDSKQAHERVQGVDNRHVYVDVHRHARRLGPLHPGPLLLQIWKDETGKTGWQTWIQRRHILHYAVRRWNRDRFVLLWSRYVSNLATFTAKRMNCGVQDEMWRLPTVAFHNIPF